MDVPAPKRVGIIAGYGLLGAGIAAVVGFGVLTVASPIATAVYHAFYLRVGPSAATEVAVLSLFVVGGVVALSASLVAGDALSDRLAHREALLAAGGVLAAVPVAFVVFAFTGLAAAPTVLALFLLAFVAVPLLIRRRYGVRSGGTPAFIGAVPVVVLLLLLAGFGLGWGWGYVVSAEEVPASSVEGETVSLDAAPTLRAELFDSGECETVEGEQYCYTQLRATENELPVVRFLADHGVRCPYVNARNPRPSGSFVTEHDGTYYRVSCGSHGD